MYRRLPDILEPLIFLAIIGGTYLIVHLSARRIPRLIEPLAARWVNTGRDQKWVRGAMWIVFWLLAFTFFAGMGFFLYEAAMGLGRDYTPK
jgi:hypothetical protein